MINKYVIVVKNAKWGTEYFYRGFASKEWAKEIAKDLQSNNEDKIMVMDIEIAHKRHVKNLPD